jgi:hypothetical protein
MALTLESSTISEFHGSLMSYYELVKHKQADHTGDWVLSRGRLPLPEITIKKELVEDRTILRDREWGTKADWRDYMLSKGYNKHNTQMWCVDHDNLPNGFLGILETMPIKHPVFTLNIQPPGSTVPAHEDTWRIWYDKHPELAKQYTFEDTVFFLVFLEDQQVGQTFSAGSQMIGWSKGSVIQLPYYCQHATSNAGFQNKMLVQCLGIKP